jgi:hypothetical protein
MGTLLGTVAGGGLVLACTQVGLHRAAAQSRLVATAPTCQAEALSIAPDLSSYR